MIPRPPRKPFQEATFRQATWLSNTQTTVYPFKIAARTLLYQEVIISIAFIYQLTFVSGEVCYIPVQEYLSKLYLTEYLQPRD